jgi:hypothetical protein
MSNVLPRRRRKWAIYFGFIIVYTILFAITATIGIAYEDRCPSGWDIWTCAENLPFFGVAAYLLGVYVLRFPLGTILHQLHSDIGDTLALFSFIPNSIIVCFFVSFLISAFKRTKGLN